VLFIDLPRFKKGKMRYISSTHRVDEKHVDYYKIPPMDKRVLADIKGPGIIVSFWLTIASPDKAILRRAVLRAYWDGEDKPSIEVPIGDFFGSGFAQYVHYHSLPIGTTSGGYYCFFPMPFERALIEVENMSEIEIGALYYMIGYYEVDDVSDMGRFHAIWRRERFTQSGKPYVILEAKGKGHYVGTLLCMEGFNRAIGGGLGFLEGNMEIIADGELAYGSTGTEDYFLSGWYFNMGTFHAPFHGLLIKDEKNFRIMAYRFHIPDPIPFERELIVRIHHGEWDEVLADYSSVAYWYQSEPHYEFARIGKELL